jgi:hypothetical protein
MQASLKPHPERFAKSIGLVCLLIDKFVQYWLAPFIMLMALPAFLTGIIWFLFLGQSRGPVEVLGLIAIRDSIDPIKG